MIHQKLLIVDGTWVVVGSTNFDSRSFGLNYEINLATRDSALAARLMADYEQDVSQSEQVSYEKWEAASAVATGAGVVRMDHRAATVGKQLSVISNQSGQVEG